MRWLLPQNEQNGFNCGVMPLVSHERKRLENVAGGAASHPGALYGFSAMMLRFSIQLAQGIIHYKASFFSADGD